jgi:formate hydrogenlyase subunit 6/NADH:ubiquinone oxidoreductase subunit I
VKSAERCIVPAWRSSRREATGLAEPTVAEFFQERARLAIDQDACIRCGACADVCPVRCIRIRKISRRQSAIGGQQPAVGSQQLTATR